TLAKGASLDRVEQVIDREVDKLRRTVPVKAEHDRAKQQDRSWARYEQDGVTFQGMLLSAGDGLSSSDFAERLLGKDEKVRGELLNDLGMEADDTHLRAMRELERFVFPNDHPYGRDPKGGADRVRRIRRRDLVAFHEAHVNPEALILAVTGDVDRRLMEDA